MNQQEADAIISRIVDAEFGGRVAVERKAWARLVRAPWREADCKAAKQALRDLGVDVDALLLEGL